MGQSETRTRRQLLGRAWRHILTHALLSRPGRGLKILSLGLIAMAAQFGAVIAVVGGARAWDSDGILSFAGRTFDLRLEAGNLGYIYAGSGVLILIFAIILGIYNRIYVTKIGRLFFEEKLVETRGLIAARISGGQAFNRGDCLAFLSRDCRFLSVSYTRILMLIQPALLLIALFGLTLYLQTSAALVMLLIGLLVMPAHAGMLTWAQRSSDDIADSAKLKSKEEQSYIDYIAQSPVPLPAETVPGFAGGPGQDGFLSAFVKRQRLSAFSQAITDSMSLGILIAFGLVLLFGGSSFGAITAGSLVLLFILWRFLTSYISSLAQAVTMVSSYEPFFRGLLDFEGVGKIAAQSGDEPPPTLTLTGEIITPIRLAIFQKMPLSWSFAAPLSEALGRPVKLIAHNFEIKRENLIQSRANLDTLDETALAEIDEYLVTQNAVLSQRTQLLLSIALTERHDDDVLMLDGRAFTDLSTMDLRNLLKDMGPRGLVLVFRGLPSRLALPPRFQLAASNGAVLAICGQAHAYQTHLEELREQMNAVVKPSNTEELETDDLFFGGVD